MTNQASHSHPHGINRTIEEREYDDMGFALLTRDASKCRITWFRFDRPRPDVLPVPMDEDPWRHFETYFELSDAQHSVRRTARILLVPLGDGTVEASHEETIGAGSSRARSVWPKCADAGCCGEAVHPDGCCIVHTAGKFRTSYLDTIRGGGALGSLRGVRLPAELLGQIIASLPQEHSQLANRRAPVLTGADFSWSTLPNFDVQYATFRDGAPFLGAHFLENALFNGCTFPNGCDFLWVIFSGEAAFNDIRTQRDALFDSACFLSGVTFARGVFESNASFNFSFFSSVMFNQAAFTNIADFTDAVFLDSTRFDGVAFNERVAFDGAVFSGQATFDGFDYPPWGPAKFKSSASFDGISVAGHISLSNAAFPSDFFFQGGTGGTFKIRNATFAMPQLWNLAGEELDLARTTFEAGGIIQVGDADVVLEECQPIAPLVITASRHAKSRPRIASIQRARVAELVFGEVDLAECRFFGAHQLDRLRIEPGAVFREVRRAPLLARRAIIREELDWRLIHQPRRWGSFASNVEAQIRKVAPQVMKQPPRPSVVASVYRALRKAREDAGDAPGAADFYYGEMEMRRLDRERSRAERAVLLAYWLISGYGLRASRAAFAFLLLVGLGSLIIWAAGFHQQPTYLHALRTAIESTSSLFRITTGTDQGLTHAGFATEWLLRWLGPLFIGLTFISLRGRVKR
jgi:Pentapeptide repeats (9 copies)